MLRHIRHSLLLAGLLLIATPAWPIEPAGLTKADAPAGAIWLDSLDLSTVEQGYGSPGSGRSVDNAPIKLAGVTYVHGLGTHARSQYEISLNASAVRFVSMVGVDDETNKRGSVKFEVWVDGAKKAESKALRGGDQPEMLAADLTGAQKLVLIATEADNSIHHDHADWAGALIFLKPAATVKPKSATAVVEPTMQIASGTSPIPAIHGPRIVGATPGRPFMFLIPATGEGPLTFWAEDLPAGLSLDPNTGIISGALRKAGESIVDLGVTGPRGKARRKLKIVAGEHKLALTPTLGWNSWNVWGTSVDDAKVRQAADWMVKSGLAAHGFSYVNIDDAWEEGRDANGQITTNRKFPDMKALADYVHANGLKIGIYSSPGPRTCGGYEGSYQHEEQDARTWAEWGVDYLKHDWCSYSEIAKNYSLEELMKPYHTMRTALDKCDRDIVYSLCQYGMGDVWEWGEQVGANCWRTTGDIGDSWSSMASIAFGQDGREKFAGPGHWNDPDMLIVGRLGWGPNLRPTRLKPNEQITHITAWCLLSSPLLMGCDLSQLDQFTIDLMTNDEVLDINQDPLGKPAGKKRVDGLIEVWARPLWDGTVAVGLFNRNSTHTKVTVKWQDLGLSGRQPVRDLWLKRDLGSYDTSFSTEVPGHGAALVKIGKPNKTDW